MALGKFFNDELKASLAALAFDLVIFLTLLGLMEASFFVFRYTISDLKSSYVPRLIILMLDITRWATVAVFAVTSSSVGVKMLVSFIARRNLSKKKSVSES